MFAVATASNLFSLAQVFRMKKFGGLYVLLDCLYCIFSKNAGRRIHLHLFSKKVASKTNRLLKQQIFKQNLLEFIGDDYD
jgi:hypothetical protein